MERIIGRFFFFIYLFLKLSRPPGDARLLFLGIILRDGYFVLIGDALNHRGQLYIRPCRSNVFDGFRGIRLGNGIRESEGPPDFVNVIRKAPVTE